MRCDKKDIGRNSIRSGHKCESEPEKTKSHSSKKNVKQKNARRLSKKLKRGSQINVVADAHPWPITVSNSIGGSGPF
jgi:hypothetical protein